MNYYIGIDIGATHLRAVVATESFDIIGRAVKETVQEFNENIFINELVRTVEAACDAGEVDPSMISAAGIGSIGPINRDAEAIVTPANVSGNADQIKIVQPLKKLLNTDQIVLHNDTTCGVIGEQYFAEPTTKNMVYLTISTGIGAGVVADGNVVYGNEGNAGEVGHMTIDPDETMKCQCGARGHWEAYCSGANIPRYARQLQRGETIETRLPVGDAEFTAKDVFDKLGEDELADLVVERLGYWNSIGFANVIQAFAPTHIAVGGSVALNNPEAILDPIRRHVPERVMVNVPDIKLTELGEDVVMRGSLLLARRQLTSRDTDKK